VSCVAPQEISHKMNGVLRMMRDEAARVRARPDLSDAERERLLRDKYSAVITPVDQVRFRVGPPWEP